MFRKFFKNVAEKLFNTGNKQPSQKVQPKPTFIEIPDPVNTNPFKKSATYHGTFANNPPGTKLIPPTLMPSVDPLDRKKHGLGIYSPTSRYAHKPWPKSKKAVA